MTQSITDLITQTATRFGVLPSAALAIAQQESQGNPYAVGDNGTSFGLYQLHWGGQGTVNGVNLPASVLEDPAYNVVQGIKAMVPAAQQAAANGLTGFAYTDYVATHSGHPGYAGVGAYPSYESGLAASYAKVTGGSAAGSQSTPNPYSPNAYPSGNDPISVLNKSLELKGLSILHPAQSIMNDAGAIALRGVLLVVGLLCITFALLAVVKKAI